MKTRNPFVAAFLLVGVINLHAATITVTSTADTGPSTLRAALASAADGDTIDASGVSDTILLTSGELLVSKSVTIVGPGPSNLMVDGNAASRVFLIGPNTVVSICSLTVTNGLAGYSSVEDSGGGIYNDHATLSLSNCTLSGNSTVSLGGGIFNDGRDGSATLTIANSTISGNSAGYGGGIFNRGSSGSATLLIRNCTLSGNSAISGGGIYSVWGAAGSASPQIVNSTLSGNSASSGGGVLNDRGTLSVNNCTFSDNSALEGSAIFNHSNHPDYAVGTLEIGSSILNISSESGSLTSLGYLSGGSSGPSISSDSGTVTSLGYNLSSDDGGGFLTATGDQINTNPKLGSLQDNGGPTCTHALLSGSSAIDKGKNFSGSGTDQRGQPRLFDDPDFANACGGDGTDIGAYEMINLRIMAVQKDGNDLQLSFTSGAGGKYVVESRSDLVTGAWAALPGTNAGTGVIVQTIVTNALSLSEQFYRIHQLP